MKNLFYIFSLFSFLTISFSLDSHANGGLDAAMKTSASAMQAQAKRMRIITENIANSDTTGINPNEDPYRRKTIYFENVYDKEKKTNIVQVRKYDVDRSDFKLVYRPEHPAANNEGYVKLPNVTRSLESMDMREAQRSYEANITAIENTKQMKQRAIELLR